MKLTKERLKAIIQEELNESFGIARLVNKSRQRTASARRAKASSAAPTTKTQTTPTARPQPSTQARRPTGKPAVPQRGPYSKEEWAEIDAIHKAHREEAARLYQKGFKDGETGIRDPEYPEYKDGEYDRGWAMALHKKKLTKEHLKTIIQEELQAVLEEASDL